MEAPPRLTACPDDAELARAVSHGPDELLAVHLRGCARCATLLREHRALVDLMVRAPFVSPTPASERRQRVRAALLAGKSLRPGRRGWVLGGAAALAAAAVLLLLGPLLRRPAAPPVQLASRAIIEAGSGARFERQAGPPHEVVRLYEGTIRTTVPPATHGETVRIVTGAGEVEVRGTVFDTTAANDRLVAVKVQRGHVIVRAASRATGSSAPMELSLEAGHGWQEPEEPAAQPLVPELPPPHRRTKARPHAPAHKAADPAEQAVAEGLALLRASNLPAAARAFDRAVRLSPQGTLAEDASFWRAVALTGSPGSPGQKAAGDEAGEEALVAFLDRFPQSARAGEISVMLGWRLLDRDPQAATARFNAGLADRSARVRKSARAGLEAAAARKGVPERKAAGHER